MEQRLVDADVTGLARPAAVPPHAGDAVEAGRSVQPETQEPRPAGAMDELSGRPPAATDSQQGLWACYEAEFSWLVRHQAIGERVACLLAARNAASRQHIRASQALPASRPHPFHLLLSATPDPAGFPACLHAAGIIGWARPMDAAEAAMLAQLWPLAACTEALLAGGGDDRLALDPATRLNRYHCAPWPRPEVISFGSCTASSPSDASFAAAGQARRSLLAAALSAGTEAALAQASRATEAAILSHYQVADLAGAVLTASGTDAALVLTAVLAAQHPRERMTSILVSVAETGSGVPDAVQARHFASLTPGSTPVARGACLDGLAQTPDVIALALRDAAGRAFTAAEMEASCTAAITAALAYGRATLHAIDGSKTGLTAPDKPALLRLRARFGAALDIVVDACQARIEAADLRWYLQHGFAVMVTGSKFFTAPGFCGAVLFPRARLDAIAAGASLPAGLAAYARLEGGIGSRHCAGLLLRWAAALYEMAAFAGHDPGQVAHRLECCADALRREVARDGRLTLVAAPRPPGLGWSGRQSVFTFTVQDGRGVLGADRLRALYVAAAADCQVGQPVLLGEAGLAGLRIAFSAAQLGGEVLREQMAWVMKRVLVDVR